MAYTAGAIVLSAASIWLSTVHRYVPEQYLDEVFHVPQAQEYCAGHWTSWDPKITTPPGLYLVASSLRPLLGCSTLILRAENALCIALVAVLAQQLFSLPLRLAKRGKTSWILSHHAINTALFPPLFFFSALYYTDIASTLSVLVFHLVRRTQRAQKDTSLFGQLLLLLLGIASLAFRQTNIFWVAVLPAAQTFLETIDIGHAVVKESMYQGAQGFGDCFFSAVKTSWKLQVIYDPLMCDATLNDYGTFIASTAACLLASLTDRRNLSSVISSMAPYAALISTFAAFVLWNGSVVLGDKSNHVATLHLPQMLYMWPYFIFFSWPIVLPVFLSLAFALLPPGITDRLPQAKRLGSTPSRPGLRYLLLFMPFAVLAVKHNTIVHPFTLADNRHYTFYVFRLLMRPWWIRYLAVPLYALCAWVCLQALRYGVTSNSRPRSAAPRQAKDSKADAVATLAPSVSFVLIWLATSTLQLITAPLVEPRYFILPWIFWRMALADTAFAAQTAADKTSAKTSRAQPASLNSSYISQSGRHSYDYRLWIETAWFLLINILTGYIFIQWKFTWASEPGKWQRFMW